MDNNTPRRHPTSRGTLWFGLVLVCVGIVLILERVGHFSFHNWWALFILIPAVSSLATAVEVFRRTGKYNIAVNGSLFSGLIILTVALLFLFELDWGKYWPLFILLPGLSATVGAFPLGQSGEGFIARASRSFQAWQFGIGVSATLLGVTFLLRNFGLFYPENYLLNWWGVFILIPALGGLISTIRLLVEKKGFSIGVLANLVATIVVAVVGVAALLGLNWNLVWPLILIGVGIVIIATIFT